MRLHTDDFTLTPADVKVTKSHPTCLLQAILFLSQELNLSPF
jgi:hypothetical protein